MYTWDMMKAVRSLNPPKNFHVDIIDHEDFLTVRADEIQFFKLTHDDKIAAVQYVQRVKDALEQNGAVVLVVRKALEQ